jgi:predicted signal transduction protein with EAL and GGDEF domain
VIPWRGWGGDEFTVILRNLASVETASEISQRIIETLQRPVSIAGRDHHVRASIGITLFPDDGNTIEELMRNADLAMYQAKDGGRSRAVFFDSMMAPHSGPLGQERPVPRPAPARVFALLSTAIRAAQR